MKDLNIIDIVNEDSMNLIATIDLKKVTRNEHLTRSKHFISTKNRILIHTSGARFGGADTIYFFKLDELNSKINLTHSLSVCDPVTQLIVTNDGRLVIQHSELRFLTIT